MIQGFENNRLNPAALKKCFEKYNAKKIFLVHGKNSFFKTGVNKIILELSQEFLFVHFSNFESNPKIEDVQKGIKLFLKEKFDLILAIGGGTAIHIAKLIKSLNQNIENIDESIINNVDFKDLTPLVAIPTTSGSGSESTHFAVVYIDKVKFSFANQKLLPDFVFLDGYLSMSGSNYLKACSGLDALCQAIESHWSVNSNKESRLYSKASMKLLIENLESFINSPNKKNINEVSIASNLAGRAINISKTTAPHAFSYALTTIFGIPHGHAVALSIPYFMKYNSNSDKLNDGICKNDLDKRFKEIFNCFKVNNLQDCILAFEKLVLNIGVDLDILKNKINNSQKEKVIESLNLERAKNNPVKIDKKDLINIFKI